MNWVYWQWSGLSGKLFIWCIKEMILSLLDKRLIDVLTKRSSVGS